MSNSTKKIIDSVEAKKAQMRAKKDREPSPVALLLRDTIANQIKEYLALETFEERKKFSETLFQIENYPSNLTGCEGAENYKVFLIERSTRMPKTEDERIHRMSCSIILLDKETHMPAFYLTAYITPNDVGALTIYQQDEHGTVYPKTVRWDSRDEK